MKWCEISIQTTHEATELIAEIFNDLGATGVVIEDPELVNDYITSGKWDYTDIPIATETEVVTEKAYLAVDGELEGKLQTFRQEVKALEDRGVSIAPGIITTSELADEDWSDTWKQYFHTMEIGERILVKPYWEEIEKPQDRVVFSINPGMSFGTGSHETTQLCLTQLEKYITPDSLMLDLGCGSGILSVVSLLLGAKKAVAVDIDPNCIDTAYENADMNGISRDRYKVISGNVVTDPDVKAIISEHKYDVVAANIVADVIIGLAPAARLYMKEGGVFITSGIIDGRQDEVRSVLESEGFTVISTERRKDWWSIVCK